MYNYQDQNLKYYKTNFYARVSFGKHLGNFDQISNSSIPPAIMSCNTASCKTKVKVARPSIIFNATKSKIA